MARARKTITPDPYAKPLAKPLPPSKSLPGKLRQFQAPIRAEFDLVSPYGAAGDQPKAIEELTKGFESGEQFQTLLGVTGSGKTFTMAILLVYLYKISQIEDNPEPFSTHWGHQTRLFHIFSDLIS